MDPHRDELQVQCPSSEMRHRAMGDGVLVRRVRHKLKHSVWKGAVDGIEMNMTYFNSGVESVSIAPTYCHYDQTVGIAC